MNPTILFESDGTMIDTNEPIISVFSSPAEDIMFAASCLKKGIQLGSVSSKLRLAVEMGLRLCGLRQP